MGTVFNWHGDPRSLMDCDGWCRSLLQIRLGTRRTLHFHRLAAHLIPHRLKANDLLLIN